ncbi:MAG: alpha/beta fold hydrolase, partial [Actinomycetota bacterium]
MNRGTSSTIVRSADGTPIAVERCGDGPALVVVPGALSDFTAWMACAPLLANGRSVQVIDRRGRGGSGDAASYEPDREIDDVLAVLAAAGGPADLLGHSSGAILALQATERTPGELRRLVLYEPPVFLEEDDRIPTDLPERLDALLASGDEDAALETFLREGPRSPDAEIRGSRRHPVWSSML